MPRPPAPTVAAQGVDVIEPDGPESTYAKLPSALVHRCDKRRLSTASCRPAVGGPHGAFWRGLNERVAERRSGALARGSGRLLTLLDGVAEPPFRDGILSDKAGRDAVLGREPRSGREH